MSKNFQRMAKTRSLPFWSNFYEILYADCDINFQKTINTVYNYSEKITWEMHSDQSLAK